MKILVTGATDLIGSYITVRLAQEGHEVLAACSRKVPALAKRARVSCISLDTARPESWPKQLAGCDVLIHVSHGWGATAPQMLAADTATSVALFEAARIAGVAQVIYTSSTAANGEVDVLNDELRQNRPVDLFGASKAATEMYARTYAFSGGPRMQIVRPGYVFGEPIVKGCDAEFDQRFIHICRAVKRGVPIRLIEHDGTQFIHAHDLAEVYLALLDYQEQFSIHYALSSEWVSWASIAEMALEEAGESTPIQLDDRQYSPLPYLFDVRKIEEDFGLSFDNEEHLRDHVRWALSLD